MSWGVLFSLPSWCNSLKNFVPDTPYTERLSLLGLVIVADFIHNISELHFKKIAENNDPLHKSIKVTTHCTNPSKYTAIHDAEQLNRKKGFSYRIWKGLIIFNIFWI